MKISVDHINQIKDKRQQDLLAIKDFLSSKFQENIEAKINAEFLAMTGMTRIQDAKENATNRFSNPLDQQFFQQLFFPEV